MSKGLKLLQLLIFGYPYLKLAYAMYQHLKRTENRDALVNTLVAVMKDDEKVSVAEWSSIGKALGVFRKGD